jgi:hypothetical protein
MKAMRKAWESTQYFYESKKEMETHKEKMEMESWDVQQTLEFSSKVHVDRGDDGVVRTIVYNRHWGRP